MGFFERGNSKIESDQAVAFDGEKLLGTNCWVLWTVGIGWSDAFFFLKDSLRSIYMVETEEWRCRRRNGYT